MATAPCGGIARATSRELSGRVDARPNGTVAGTNSVSRVPYSAFGWLFGGQWFGSRIYSQTMWRFVLLVVGLALSSARSNEVIADPIADYLSMDVPDRAENAGRLLVLKRVEVDMEGNGKPVVFIGTWYRKSGPNTWLWIAYAPVEGGYQRITDSDVLIDFAGIYVGRIPALNRNGLVQAYSLELDNQDRDQSNMISDLEYYFLDGGKLVQQGAGALDRDDPDQKATFDYFFGPKRIVSGSPKTISYTVGELAKRGYPLPSWAKGQ
jgi:hypothetical protein